VTNQLRTTLRSPCSSIISQIEGTLLAELEYGTWRLFLLTKVQSTIPCLIIVFPVAMLVQTTADSVGSKVRSRAQAPSFFSAWKTGSLP
jgi:hypothetical protein